MDVLSAPGGGTLEVRRDAGDRWSEVFAVHRTQLARAARRVVGDAHLAEDLVHDAYLRIAEGPQARDAPEQPLSYAHRVVRNLALDRCRRDALESRLFEPEDAGAAVAAPSAHSPETMAIDRHQLACVAGALRALPERTRRAFELYRLEGRTQRDIGVELGVSAATVNALIREALEHCRAAVRAR
ncbi:MAG TPA: sigma-70 family RNA polymerase sigma factor [Methylibium sp.]|uniref:sigma-70 family RNA polymerase sigma factor n=1 Tax=Methylibium sp. TaxID=2067992 RepID=UPI002DB99623|nr:sigma-70 family RNA polymerase sigma factor [Methylibium sp.]HEU4460554.1 sigma-70 family RNA polymerase sigma factor [Methylibium sp.]